MKVLLGSLKYSAGLASGFTSVGNNLTQIGANVRYMVAHDYEWLLPDVQNVDYIPTQASKKGLVQDFFTYPFQLRKVVQGIFRKDVPDIFWLYNSHPLNFAVMRLYKSVNKNGRAIIHLHEPYKPEKSGYSKAGQLYFWIVEQFQTMSLNDADDVVLPSGHALELFQQRYPDYKGGMHITPLIIPD